MFPPLTYETVGRDIGDLIYERLADLTPRRATIDEAAYAPGLASKWERVDSVTWRFTSGTVPAGMTASGDERPM